MRMTLVKSNEYFSTYHIYNEECLLMGIIEDHWNCKERYFVGWKLDKPSKLSGHNTGKTKSFDTIDEAMIYSVGEVVSR